MVDILVDYENNNALEGSVRNPMFRFTQTQNLNLHSGSGSTVWLNQTLNIRFGFRFEHCSEGSEPDRGQSSRYSEYDDSLESETLPMSSKTCMEDKKLTRKQWQVISKIKCSLNLLNPLITKLRRIS